MASTWSAADIENDLRRLLNITASSKAEKTDCTTERPQNNSVQNGGNAFACVTPQIVERSATLTIECETAPGAISLDASCARAVSPEAKSEAKVSCVVASTEETASTKVSKLKKTKRKAKKRKEKQKINTLQIVARDVEQPIVLKNGSDNSVVVDGSSSTVAPPPPQCTIAPPMASKPNSVKDISPKDVNAVNKKIEVMSGGKHLHTVEGSCDVRGGTDGLKGQTSRVNDLSKFNLAQFDAFPNVPPSDEILSILDKEWIFWLKKKSARHPKARYVCGLCVYHCDNLAVCAQHLKSSKHISMKEEHDLNVTLQHIPLPSTAQSEVQSDLLQTIVVHEGFTEEDALERKRRIFKQILELIKETLPVGCELQMFGSSVTQLGLKGSDLNINLEVKNAPNLIPAIILENVETVLAARKDVCSNVNMDTCSNFPSIRFLHRKTATRCVIGLNHGPCVKTTSLIAQYVKFDARVQILCVSLRYWAKLCRVNEQEKGTLPPHTFDLMVVFFLQQCEPPVLPVFHEHFRLDGTFDIEKLKEAWKSDNQNSVGFLWIEMLRFYAIVFPRKDIVVCICQSSLLTTLKKNWRGRKFAVEDPYVNKRNLTRCVTSPKVYEFIMMCLKLSFRYFGIPQLKKFGPLFNKITRQRERNSSNTNDAKNRETVSVTKLNKDEETSLLSSKVMPERTRQESFATDTSAFSEEDDDEVDGVLATTVTTANENELPAKKENDPIIDKDIERLPLTNDLLEKFYCVKKDEMNYYFVWKFLTGGKVPVLECSLCKKQGHLKDNCPDEILPRLHALPPMQSPFMAVLNNACLSIYTLYSPTREELLDREKILNNLEGFVRKTYPDAQLNLFGSSCNGFGFRQSDLDICLTFQRNKTGEELQFAEITLNLAEKMKKYKAVHHVVAIPTAKVPIVKFILWNRPLECDISLYNTLAQHNTHMLYVYSEIDPRVKVLGFTMKYFAKICDIGDASRGSLSSYAYILMVIYFLQQRNPPVLPVLQQMFDKTKPPPEDIVDGWNAWFFKDIKNLEKVWKFYGRNRESVGELWLGLLRFYTEEFNFKKHVISIRQLEPLSRFEKLWNKRTIAIEDPFNLSHNLGSGVSRKMNTYIMKTLIMARLIFGTPLMFPPKGYQSLVDYLFDPRQLTDGPPPNDRCCRACGHIGHVVRDCPRKRGVKEQSAADKTIDKKENSSKRNPSLEHKDKKERSSTPSEHMKKTVSQQNEKLPWMQGNENITSVRPPPGLLPKQQQHISQAVSFINDPIAFSHMPRGATNSGTCNVIPDDKKARFTAGQFNQCDKLQQQQQQQLPPPQAVSFPPPGFSNVIAVDKQLPVKNVLSDMRHDVLQSRERMSPINVCPQTNLPLPRDCAYTPPQSSGRYISPFSLTPNNVCSSELLRSDPSIMLRFSSLPQLRAGGIPMFATVQNATPRAIPPFISATQRFPPPNIVVQQQSSSHPASCVNALKCDAMSQLTDHQKTFQPFYVPSHSVSEPVPATYSDRKQIANQAHLTHVNRLLRTTHIKWSMNFDSYVSHTHSSSL